MAAESFQLEICKEIKKVSNTKAPLAVCVNYEIVELHAVFPFQQKSTELSAACIGSVMYSFTLVSFWVSGSQTMPHRAALVMFP